MYLEMQLQMCNYQCNYVQLMCESSLKLNESFEWKYNGHEHFYIYRNWLKIFFSLPRKLSYRAGRLVEISHWLLQCQYVPRPQLW